MHLGSCVFIAVSLFFSSFSLKAALGQWIFHGERLETLDNIVVARTCLEGNTRVCQNFLIILSLVEEVNDRLAS